MPKVGDRFTRLGVEFERVAGHRIDRREYLRRIRGEVVEVETDAFGCSIHTDRTGEYEAITISCPEGDA